MRPFTFLWYVCIAVFPDDPGVLKSYVRVAVWVTFGIFSHWEIQHTLTPYFTCMSTTPESVTYAYERIVARHFMPCFDIKDSDELLSTEQLKQMFLNMVPDSEQITDAAVFNEMVKGGFEMYSKDGMSLWMLRKSSVSFKG
jgi:hypothetical protein